MLLVKNERAGFTLLELSVVILLMAILLGFSLPRFSALFDSKLVQESQKIASLLRKMRLQAILKSQNIRFVFDTQNSRYSILTSKSSDPSQFIPHEKYSNPISLPEPLEIYQVTQEIAEVRESRFAGEKIEFDKIFGKTYQFNIDSSGFVDLFTIKLKDQDSRITVSIVNIMGKIVIGEELPL